MKYFASILWTSDLHVVIRCDGSNMLVQVVQYLNYLFKFLLTLEV